MKLYFSPGACSRKVQPSAVAFQGRVASRPAVQAALAAEAV